MTDPNETNRREAGPAPRSPGSAAPSVDPGDGEQASAADQAVANQERLLEAGEENPV